MVYANKLKVAVIGYGNVAEGVLAALETTTDMRIAGIVVRDTSLVKAAKKSSSYPLASNIQDLGAVDVAVLAVPSKSVPEVAIPLLAAGINTVDSYDRHGQELWLLRQQLALTAIQTGAKAIVAAGWDPGTDSLLRAIFSIQAPRGVTYTDFGPGLSMGHTVAAGKIAGVKSALAFTLPLGLGQHRRLVYIELAQDYELEPVVMAIKNDDYFAQEPTLVRVTNSVNLLWDNSHQVKIERRGAAGKTGNQYFCYQSRIVNPALTGQILVSAARASTRMPAGAYTMLEVPLVHFLPEDLQSCIERYA